MIPRNKKTKRLFRTLTSVCVVLSLISVGAECFSKEGKKCYYISPGGSDESGDGTRQNPWKTIEYAKDRIKDEPSEGSDIEINLGSGVYVQSDAIVFGVDDGAADFTVTYKGDGTMPVIIGGETIGGWEYYGDGIYKTNVGEREFNFLTENGEQAIPARYPDNEYLKATGENKKNSFYIPENADIPLVSDISGLETYIWSGSDIAWFSDTVSVSTYNQEKNHIVLGTNTRYTIGDGSRFYLQGAFEFLNSPGEFYLDKKTNDLYYYPRGDINSADIIVPNQANVIEFRGESPEQAVENIKISGVRICMADRGYSGVYMQNASNIEISDCKIENVGKHGVFMDGAAVNNTVKNCEISDIGYDGVLINNVSETKENNVTLKTLSKGNVVTNCMIHDGGKLVGDGSGVQIYDSAKNTVSHCRIYNFPRYGISIKGAIKPYSLKGQTVEGLLMTEDNFREAMHSEGNIIMYNDVSNVNTDSQDTGVFESWCSDVGNIVANNRFHHSGVTFSEAFGIYIDDAASGFTIKNNIVDNLQKFPGGMLGAVMHIKGIGNTVEGNILANNNGHGAFQVMSMAGEDNYDIRFMKNTVYNSGSYIYRSKSAYPDGRISGADENVFFNSEKRYEVIGVDSAIKNIWDWQEIKQMDENSLPDTDPMFFDAEADDYRYKYNSPVYKNGIEDICEGEIGLTADYPFAESEALQKLYLEDEGEKIYGSVISLRSGEEISLSLYARTVNGYRVIPQNAEFLIADNSIARCDNNRIIGIKKGKTEITILTGGKTLKYDVFVDDLPVSIEIKDTDTKLGAGDEVCLAPYVVTEFGRILRNGIRFSLENTGGDVIGTDGLNVTAIGTGTASTVITAVSEGFTLEKTIDFNVCDNIIEALNVLSEIVLVKGQQRQLGIEAVYSDGTIKEIEPSKLSFKTLDENILAIDENGVITGMDEGITTVFAVYSEEGFEISGRLTCSVRGKARNPSEKQYGSDCDDYYGVNVNVEDKTDIVGSLDGGNRIMYGGFDFSNREYTDIIFSIAVPEEHAGSPVYVRLDDPKGVVIAKLNVESTGSFSNMTEQRATLDLTEELTGIHNIYLTFSKTGTGNIAWFKFISRTEDCMDAVSKSYFENGAVIPAVGVPGYFGDIFVQFKEQAEEDSMERAVSLTDDRGNQLKILAEANEDVLRISGFGEQLLPETEYTLNLQGSELRLADGRSVINNYTTSFITSADLTRQMPVFEDSFENGIGNWKGSGGKFGENAGRTDTKSLIINKTKNGDVNDPFLLDKEIPENGVYEAWIYDDGDFVNKKTLLLNLIGTDADGNDAQIRFGIKDAEYYIFTDSTTSAPSVGVMRTKGWHRFSIDFTNPDSTKAYIDGVCVAVKNTKLKRANGFGFLNLWRNNLSVLLADDVKIYQKADYQLFADDGKHAFLCDKYFNPITEVKPGAELYIAARVENNTKGKHDAVIIAAGYEDGILSDIKFSPTITVLPGEAEFVKMAYTMPSDTANKEIKLFLWKGAGSLEPIEEHTLIKL